MALNRNLADFYNQIQNEGGLRYQYQFLVRLAIDQDIFGPGTRGQYSGVDEVLRAQYGLNLETLGGLVDPNSGENQGIDISFLAKSTNLPQTELATTKVSYFAQSFEFPGIVRYGDTWTVNVQLDQRMIIYKQLRLWQEMMSSIARNSGGNHTIPNARGEILFLDQYGKYPQRKYWIEGIYPTNVPQIDMQYQEGSTELKDANITFKVQYFR
jgi:hypothetical protein